MKHLKGIPGYEDWKAIEEIHDGWSYDEKYKVTNSEGQSFLLRVASTSKYDRKKELLKNFVLLNRDVEQISKVVEFGTFDESSFGYAIFTWVEGVPLLEGIKNLDTKKRYDLGLTAGKMLKEIHQIPVPIHLESWEKTYNPKINRILYDYENIDESIIGDEEMIQYIEEHRHLLKERPIVLQHGDFHIGNMVLSEKKQLGIIDFDRIDYGDPWEEFNRLIFTAGACTDMANGLIHGYFDFDIPEDFFKHLKLYLFVNQLASIPWALKFDEEELEVMRKNGENLMSWYSNSDIPSWYQSIE